MKGIKSVVIGDNTSDSDKICDVCDDRCAECSEFFYKCDSCAEKLNRLDNPPTCPCMKGYFSNCKN